MTLFPNDLKPGMIIKEDNDDDIPLHKLPSLIVLEVREIDKDLWLSSFTGAVIVAQNMMRDKF